MSLRPHPATPLQTTKLTHVLEHNRHVVLDLLGPHVEVFFSALEHWRLCQAFLVNRHPSRWCLCTIQHSRDRSRQFCKTLCNVLLTRQLSSSVAFGAINALTCCCNARTASSISGTESDRTPESRVQRSEVSTSQLPSPETHRDSRKLSSTRDFASRPPTSSTLVQATTDELHSSRDSPTSSIRSANK